MTHRRLKNLSPYEKLDSYLDNFDYNNLTTTELRGVIENYFADLGEDASEDVETENPVAGADGVRTGA